MFFKKKKKKKKKYTRTSLQLSCVIALVSCTIVPRIFSDTLNSSNLVQQNFLQNKKESTKRQNTNVK